MKIVHAHIEKAALNVIMYINVGIEIRLLHKTRSQRVKCGTNIRKRENEPRTSGSEEMLLILIR